jgi:hypothetical protein
MTLRSLRAGDPLLIPVEPDPVLRAVDRLVDELPEQKLLPFMMQLNGAAQRAGGRLLLEYQHESTEAIMSQTDVLDELRVLDPKTDPARWFNNETAKLMRLGDGDCRGPGGEILYSRRKFEAWKAGGEAWAAVKREAASRRRREGG